jgi:hypothetical protein
MATEIFARNNYRETPWQGLYVRMVAQTILLAGFLPLTAVGVYLMGDTWYFFVVPYVLTWLFVGYQLNEWKCPSCLRSFLKRGQYGFTRPSNIICINCGLGIGEERDPNRSARRPADPAEVRDRYLTK